MVKRKKKVRRMFALFVIALLFVQQFPMMDSVAAVTGNVWDGSIAQSYQGGSGTEDDPYLIASGRQLARMAREVNAGRETNKYYQMTEDVNLGNREWIPIGNADNPFSGHFDGMGYRISNLYMSGSQSVSSGDAGGSVSTGDVGIARRRAYIEPETVEEIGLVDAAKQAKVEDSIAQIEAAAAQAREAATDIEENFDYSGIENVEEEVRQLEKLMENRHGEKSEKKSSFSRNFTSLGTYDYVGLFGYVFAGTIQNTGVVESDIYGGLYTGGIAGYGCAGTEIVNCYFEGVIDSGRAEALGGIVGHMAGDITSCYNKGLLGDPLSDPGYIGGIAGASSGYISGCVNAGKVSGYLSYTGGIVGYFTTNKYIESCFNNGEIGTDSGLSTFVGGIAGHCSKGLIIDCANQGKVSGGEKNGFTAGIAGTVNIVMRSYNTGDVSGYFSAGLCGSVYGGALKNYNGGTISGAMGSAITCNLGANASVGIRSNHYRIGSAPRAIYLDAAYPYGGTVSAVQENIMKGVSWANTLGSPYMADTPWYNNGYPIHEDINYNPAPWEAEMISGTFLFSSHRTEENSPGQLEEDYPADYYYSDRYFAQGASVYNQSLATMSLCLELSAFGSNVGGTEDYSYKYRNAEQLLTEIGFEHIEANEDYKRKPERNTFGVIVAQKEIEIRGVKKTVIVLVTRGGGYEMEWGANFEVGEYGHHDGFEAASDKAYEFLSDYITEYGEDFQQEVVLWLMGYSRAAAATNLLAGRLTYDGQVGDITYDSQDVYAYCFATPMGRDLTDYREDFTNIHNIVNPCDLVTKVAPAYWIFGRYGVDEPVIPGSLTSDNEEYYSEMLAKFNLLGTEWVEESLTGPINNRTHILNNFQGKKIGFYEVDEEGGIHFQVPVVNDDRTMSEFLDSLIRTIAIGAEDRENYTQNLQEAISTVVAEILGNGEDYDKWVEATACIKDIFIERSSDIVETFLLLGYDEAEELAYQCVYDGIVEAGIDIDDPYYESLSPDTFSEAMETMLGVVIASLTRNGFDDFLTLFYNTEGLMTAHYPELYFSWLQTQDPNYDGEPMFFASAYRTVRISSPVDVSVYDSSGTLVAQIIEDELEEIGDGTIAASLNARGEKVIYLPSDEAYDISLVATADGELNYSIGEYSYYTGSQAKMVNYYDVPIEEGEVIEGTLPKFQSEDILNVNEGSDLEYNLQSDLQEITPSVEFKGEAAREAVYTVSAVSNDMEKGNVIGGGVHSEGAYTVVCGIAAEGYEFEGWYEEGNLVSTDIIYRFRTEKDTLVTAVFR